MLSKINPVSFPIFKSVNTFVKVNFLHYKAHQVQKRRCKQNRPD